MNDADVHRLLTLIKEVWPNYHAPSNNEALQVRIDAWMLMLEGDGARISYIEAREALRRLAQRGDAFAPSPGQIYAEVMDQREAEAEILRYRDRYQSLPESGEYDQEKMDWLKSLIKRPELPG
jgi:hypothetical protein